MRLAFSNNQPTTLEKFGLYKIPENERADNIKKVNKQRKDSLIIATAGGAAVGVFSYIALSIRKSQAKLMRSLEAFALTALVLDEIFLFKNTANNIKQHNNQYK